MLSVEREGVSSVKDGCPVLEGSALPLYAAAFCGFVVGIGTLLCCGCLRKRVSGVRCEHVAIQTQTASVSVTATQTCPIIMPLAAVSSISTATSLYSTPPRSPQSSVRSPLVKRRSKLGVYGGFGPV